MSEKSAFFYDLFQQSNDDTKAHSIEIMFGFTPEKFQETEDPNEIEVHSTEGRVLTFGYIIKSLGTESTHSLSNKYPAIGWAKQPIGAIGEANKQAVELSKEIKAQYLEHKSPFKKDNGLIDLLGFRAKIDNRSAKQIIEFLGENPEVVIKNSTQLHDAMRYEVDVKETNLVDLKSVPAVTVPAIDPPSAGSTTFVDRDGKITTMPTPDLSVQLLYDVLKNEGILNSCECDGDGICGECVVQNPSFGMPPADEMMVLNALGMPVRNRRLSCQFKDNILINGEIVVLGET